MIIELKFTHMESGRKETCRETEHATPSKIHEMIGLGFRLTEIRPQDTVTMLEVASMKLRDTEEELSLSIKALVKAGHTVGELAGRCNWPVARVEELLNR